ncbi:MAG: filamentous hemagglutinin family protein [Rhodospirillales bacterium]
MAFGAVYGTGDKAAVQQVGTVNLRPTQSIGGNSVQGYLYPLAQMLPAGDASWSMDFVAGANLAAADANAVLARTTLDGAGLATPANTINQAPGSLLIDDQHYFAVKFSSASSAVTAFSVIRTGTGDLTLVAGGNVDQSSLYGIYTAGTQDPLGNGQDAQFDTTRQALGPNGLLLPGKSLSPDVSALISSTYQAYYPNGGGDVLIAVGGDMTGDVLGLGNVSSGTAPSDAVGNWLWRQGSTALGQPTAWWINFGTLVAPLTSAGNSDGSPVQLTGFQGIGALGGGNVAITIGGDAGQMTARDEAGRGPGSGTLRGEGLVVAVGGTGRLVPGSTGPLMTGGGDITVTIGGALNPLDAAAYGTGAITAGPSSESPAVNGDLIDIRGDIDVTAGSIGRIDYAFNSGSLSAQNLYDPRPADPFAPNDGIPNGGIVVVPGDGSSSLSAMRDLVLGGAGDPGRVAAQGLTADTASDVATGIFTGFTLWQSGTSITLFSAGGNVTPTTVPNVTTTVVSSNSGLIANNQVTDFRSEYPPTLMVTAATGDIIYGQNNSNPATAGSNSNLNYSLETMPSPTGQVQFLAGGSIFANGYAVDISGADPLGLSRVADPAYATIILGSAAATNVLKGPEADLTPLAMFALEADTPTTNLHADDPAPARFYAATGDIVNFTTGETLDFLINNTAQTPWYIAAKPVWILAGNDIVSTGSRPNRYPGSTLFALQENQTEVASDTGYAAYSSGDLFLNTNPTDISVISAGRDILSAYAYVGGPGLLEVTAGRNLFQAAYSLGNTQELFFGSFKSLGDNLIPGSSLSVSSGAGISVLAGVGAAGPDTKAFADLYFDPANQANLTLPITDPANRGKVQQVYTTQLVAWLAANFGYAGGTDGALAFFQALPSVDQAVFVRSVFFDELQASGAQEADPTSRFFKSYVRGRQAIDSLLPSTGTQVTPGVPVGYTGNITMYSGTVTGVFTDPQNNQPATFDGGVATLFGGNVQVLDPGGTVEFGIPGGPAPGNSSGIVTFGAGDIDIYALGSVLLGKSRIFADGGGNIVIWSSEGDINAGIGAKTTISYNPPVLVYDDEGDITQTPPANTSGAGIATLQPLPSVPAGDVNLIAPGGTIDAGEAGIRVSGNLVLAAARVSGTANISVKGSTAGAPTVSVASLGAVEAAGAAAGAASAAAQSQSQRTAESRDVASVVEVDVLSIGGSYEDERRKRKHAQ